MMIHISGAGSNTPEDRMQVASAINQSLGSQLHRANDYTSSSQINADITRILDAACYTSAETAEEVCSLLYAAINQVRQKAKWAEEVQSRRKGDPGTERVEEIRYIPEVEVSYYAQSGTHIAEVPGFRLAESRISPQS